MNIADILFLINLGWLMTHELDAIQQHEWRIFPFTAPFSEVVGYRVFTAAHIPLFAVMIGVWQVAAFQVGLDLFLIAHAGLHWLYRHHPLYEFKNEFSQLLIWGGVPLGLLHLFMLYM